jgi:hypothetical protein
MFRRSSLWRITKRFLLCLFSRIWMCMSTRSLPVVCVSNFARHGMTPWNYLWSTDISCFVTHAVQARVARCFAETQWKSDRWNNTYPLYFRHSPGFRKKKFCTGERNIHDIIANYHLNSEALYYISWCYVGRPTQFTSSEYVHPAKCLLASHLPTPSLILHPQMLWLKRYKETKFGLLYWIGIGSTRCRSLATGTTPLL